MLYSYDLGHYNVSEPSNAQVNVDTAFVYNMRTHACTHMQRIQTLIVFKVSLFFNIITLSGDLLLSYECLWILLAQEDHKKNRKSLIAAFMQGDFVVMMRRGYVPGKGQGHFILHATLLQNMITSISCHVAVMHCSNVAIYMVQSGHMQLH